LRVLLQLGERRAESQPVQHRVATGRVQLGNCFLTRQVLVRAERQPLTSARDLRNWMPCWRSSSAAFCGVPISSSRISATSSRPRSKACSFASARPLSRAWEPEPA
jgi:hypothetical protein